MHTSIHYLTKDVESVIHFYTTYLGFNTSHHDTSDHEILNQGHFSLIVNEPDDEKSEELSLANWRIRIEVEELDELIHDLEEDGITLKDSLHTNGKIKEAVVSDPQGNLIELIEKSDPKLLICGCEDVSPYFQ